MFSNKHGFVSTLNFFFRLQRSAKSRTSYSFADDFSMFFGAATELINLSTLLSDRQINRCSLSVLEILYGYRFSMYVNDNNLLRKNKKILTKELCLAGVNDILV